DLPPLLDKADQGSRPVEAAILFDLQTVCLDHEREVYSLDLVEWLRSAGHRPIKRPLPSQRLVRINKHLRNAYQRLAAARLADAQEFIRGDPLLRLDRRLSTMLDGVYRPSEIYMRWLERLTAFNFGTATGRLITRYVTIPFGAAFVLQEGLGLVLDKLGVL